MLWTPTADEAAVLDAAIANLDGWSCATMMLVRRLDERVARTP